MAEEQVAEDKVEEPKPEGEDKITQFESRLTQMEERLKNQDRVIQKKDSEIQRLRGTLESRDEETALSKAMIAAMSQQTGRSEEEVEEGVRTKQPDFLKQYDDILEKSKRKRQEEEQGRQLNGLQRAVTAAGFTDKDPEYWEIFGRAAGGDFDSAHARIEELTQKKTQVVKKEPQVNKEQETEEAARKMLEDNGLLKTETGGPTASSGKVYTKAQIDAMPALEYRKTFPGGLEEVLQAIAEGRIRE